MPIQSSKYAQHLKGSPSFRRNVANQASGSTPDSGRNPTITRSTYEAAYIAEGNRRPNHGMPSAGGSGAIDVRPTGVFTVADNNFSTGTCIIKIGDFEFVSGVDFVAGAGVNATATNIAAAINALPGWSASALAADVTVFYPHAGKVRFEARHHGTIVNITPLNPADGFLQYGGTQLEPPTLT